MRESWNSLPLGEVATLQRGFDLPKKDRHVGPFPLVSSSGVIDTHTEAKVRGPGVVTGRSGSIGAVYFVEDDFWPLNTTLYVKEFHGNDPRFIEHFLRYFDLNRFASGAGVPTLNRNNVHRETVFIPPLAEQKRIVAILDEAFAGIDRVIANTEKNLANARELFESYLNALLSHNGSGWVQEKMGDVCEGKITDGTHQTPKYFDDGYIFLSSRNVTSRLIDWQNVKYIDETQHISMQKRLSPRMNDILLAKNGTTGVAAIVDKDIVFDIYVSLALLRPSKKILPHYLLHFVNSSLAKHQFNKRLKGTGVPNLHLNEIREVLVSYPDRISEQEVIIKKIDEVLTEQKRIESIYQQKLNSLNELKQSILQKAFAGELTAEPDRVLAEVGA